MKYHLLALRSSLLGSSLLGSSLLGSNLLGSNLGSNLLGRRFLILGKHKVDKICLFGVLGVAPILVTLSFADCPKVF